MNKLYNGKSAGASKSELIKFVKWCKKKFDYEPAIIGGWAVYSYAKKEKSIDIDVVFTSKKKAKSLMKQFFKENNYKKEELHDQQEHFVKELKTGEKIIELRFDYYDYEDKNNLVENSKISIPWKLIGENNEYKKINSSKIKVPSIELLLLFKAKALRDRDCVLNARGIRIKEAERLRIKSKILKDKRDIRSLMSSGKINESILGRLLKQTGFEKYFEQTIKEVKQKEY